LLRPPPPAQLRQPENLSLWRYGIISQFLHQSPAEPESFHRRLAKVADMVWTDTKGQRRTIPAETLRGWIYRYRKGGIQALAGRPLVHAAFYTTEGVEALIQGLSIAVKRFGIPQRFYTDNGSAFRSLHLQMVAARLGFTLPHTPAYTPKGRGKIERFFRTVRDQFLEGTSSPTVATWNQKLSLWLDEYHHRQHSGIEATPLEKRLSIAKATKNFPDVADPLGKAFLLESKRKVRRDGTINLDSKTWDIPDSLPGEIISVLHARWEPNQILVGPEFRVAKPVDLTAQANRYNHSPVRGNKETKS
jgi:hypothetical protein